MCQRPEPQSPCVAQLLSQGDLKVLPLKAKSLGFGPLQARRTVVGGVNPVATTLDWPDRQAVRSKRRSSLGRQRHMHLIGGAAQSPDRRTRSLGAACPPVVYGRMLQ